MPISCTIRKKNKGREKEEQKKEERKKKLGKRKRGQNREVKVKGIQKSGKVTGKEEEIEEESGGKVGHLNEISLNFLV